jgi:3-hydroxyisobutyrate dehydrogenase-like beta-hydroxyacid dehydrogenase
MPSLGFVGLGAMGGRIAARLLANGHAVTGFNRTRDKAHWLIERGLRWADSPRAVAQAADVIFTMVTDSAALEAITSGPDGLLEGLAAGKIFVDMSTVSPPTTRALATQATQRGASMLDCPVSGSILTLEQGKLTMMVGGDRATFDTVHPLLLEIGTKATDVGSHGAAVSMKIALNLSIGAQLLAFSEGILLAEKSGIDRKIAVDVFLSSAMASPMLQYRGPFVLEMPASAWFDVRMLQKDAGLALALGRELGVPLPTTALSNEMLSAARSIGLEAQDCAALFDVLATLSGVTR